MTPAARTACGAGGAVVLQRVLVRRPPGGAARWTRPNFRGVPVSLVSGPVLALTATVASPLPVAAAVVAGLGCGAVGRYDDTVGRRVAQRSAKGFRGHLSALRHGQVTSGLVKVAGIGVVGVAAAVLGGSRRPLDALLDGAVVAGTANLLNLFDLRPGRALKVALALAVATGQTGTAAVAGVLLPSDLGERTMLGDTGANALGALLGLGLVARAPGRPSRVRVLGVLAGLTAASEVVSFSRVLDAVAPLRALDRLGRAA